MCFFFCEITVYVTVFRLAGSKIEAEMEQVGKYLLIKAGKSEMIEA